MEKLWSSLDEVISCIRNSFEYQKCLSLQKQMNENEEVKKLINKVKTLQKKYVRSGYSEDIKKELDQVESNLMSIPIYVVYMQNLSVVNEMIDYVRDSFNEYFDNLFQEKY